MPQLWLTYQELADQLDCGDDQARAAAVHRGWTRKRSRDGLTRVLLPVDLMAAYFAGARTTRDSTDGMVTALRATLALMSPADADGVAPAFPDIPAPRRRIG